MQKRIFTYLFAIASILGGMTWSCTNEFTSDETDNAVLKDAGISSLSDMELLGKNLFFDKISYPD